MNEEITGHEVEMAELEKQASSPEAYALTIKLCGQALAGYGETLRLAALGQLQTAPEDIFGERQTPEQQVEDANAAIDRQMQVLTKALHRKYEVLLAQDPYLGDNGDYCASGYLASENENDETGPTVKVTWAALEGAEDMDDESSRCDWRKPESIVHYRLGDITEKSVANAIYQKALMGKVDGLDGTSESSAKSTKIIVVLEGGSVQSVLTADGGISVAIIDYDNQADQDNGIFIPQGNGKMASAYASIIEPEIIDRARVAELYDVVDNHISIGDVEDSLADAKKIANAKAAFVLLDPQIDASFSGKFMGVTDHHCVISGGRTAVIIELSNLQMLPDRVGKDEMVDISFKNCKGTIDLTKSKEVER